MKNLDIGIEDILEEYNKYVLSTLINKEYDFKNLREKMKSFESKFNLFGYDDNKSDSQLIKDLKLKIDELNVTG